MVLSRDDILKADDLPTEDVDVPEWGGSVSVRGLTGEERDAFEVSLQVQRPSLTQPGVMESVPDLGNMRAKLVARVVVDEDGKRLFTDSDVFTLGGKSAAGLNRVYDVAARLSGLSPEAAQSIEGNSGAAPSGASDSDSPATSE